MDIITHMPTRKARPVIGDNYDVQWILGELDVISTKWLILRQPNVDILLTGTRALEMIRQRKFPEFRDVNLKLTLVDGLLPKWDTSNKTAQRLNENAGLTLNW